MLQQPKVFGLPHIIDLLAIDLESSANSDLELETVCKDWLRARTHFCHVVVAVLPSVEHKIQDSLWSA